MRSGVARTSTLARVVTPTVMPAMVASPEVGFPSRLITKPPPLQLICFHPPLANAVSIISAKSVTSGSPSVIAVSNSVPENERILAEILFCWDIFKTRGALNFANSRLASIARCPACLASRWALATSTSATACRCDTRSEIRLSAPCSIATPTIITATQNADAAFSKKPLESGMRVIISPISPSTNTRYPMFATLLQPRSMSQNLPSLIIARPMRGDETTTT